MEKKRSVFGRLAALALATVLLCSLVLSGCGSQPTGDETQTSDQPQQTAEGVNVNYGLSNPWDSLMPYYSVSGSNYSRIIYDKIYARLAYVQPDGTCLPRAAEKWESTEDGHAIVFTLNQTAAFHDGTPVTAQHWVETFQLITDPACEILGKTALSCLPGTDDTGAAVAGETLGVEAVDDYMLKLSFKQPTIPEEFLVDKNRDIYVLPTYLLKDIPADQVVESDFWRKPIGSGPCKFVSEVSGSNLVLEANKDYQLGAPGFDTLTITVMDKSNLLTALISGDLDYYAFGGNVSEENKAVAEQAGFTVEEGTTPTNFYELMLNCATIDSVDLRQAINKALDKELLCQQSAGTRGTVTSSSILPDTPYSSPAVTGTYDPAGAEALVAKSGYDGKTFSLACTSQRASLAALVQQDLEAVGIKVEIETVDSATMFAGMSDGTYDMGLASHTPTTLPLWFTASRFTEENNIFHVPDLAPYTEMLSAPAGPRRSRCSACPGRGWLCRRPGRPCAAAASPARSHIPAASPGAGLFGSSGHSLSFGGFLLSVCAAHLHSRPADGAEAGVRFPQADAAVVAERGVLALPRRTVQAPPRVDVEHGGGDIPAARRAAVEVPPALRLPRQRQRGLLRVRPEGLRHAAQLTGEVAVEAEAPAAACVGDDPVGRRFLCLCHPQPSFLFPFLPCQ